MSLYFPSGSPSFFFLAVLPVLDCLCICCSRNSLTIGLWPHLCVHVCYQLCGFDHLTAQWHLAEQNRDTNKRVCRLYADWFTQISMESGGPRRSTRMHMQARGSINQTIPVVGRISCNESGFLFCREVQRVSESPCLWHFLPTFRLQKDSSCHSNKPSRAQLLYEIQRRLEVEAEDEAWNCETENQWSREDNKPLNQSTFNKA